MIVYRFIKTKGEGARYVGWLVPRMFRLDFSFRELKTFKFSFVKERLNGWTIWYVCSKDAYDQAIKGLDELKKTRLFTYRVSE